MHTHTTQKEENKSPSFAQVSSQKSGGEMGVSFNDNRMESVAQCQLQEMSLQSPSVKQTAQLQTMANNFTSEQQVPNQKKENSTGLHDQLKSGIENLSGYSMDDVKVHYNSTKPAQLQAHAYAQGTDIHVASGQEKHLPHEAWHVVQQKQGRVKPTIQMKGGVNVNDDQGLEKEADVMGGKALQMKIASQNLTFSVAPQQNHSLSAPIQLMAIVPFNKALEKLVPIINGKKLSDFKKWISETTGQAKPHEGVDNEVHLNTLYQTFLMLPQAAAADAVVAPRLVQPPVSLTYQSLYAGNQEESMKPKSISRNLLVPDILAENTLVLSNYVEQIKANSDTPNATKVLITTSHRALTYSAAPEKLIKALKIIVERNLETILSIVPVPMSYAHTAGELSKLTAHINPKDFEMGAEEREATLAMDAQGVDNVRDPAELDNLYQRDSITIFMAMKLNGGVVNNNKLLMLNRIIQTSGTNKELMHDTASKAGKIRTSPIALVDGIHLEHPDNIPIALGGFEADYNSFLTEIKGKKPNGDMARLHYFYRKAVLLHQQFIQIHPFSNGNGRVARALFYNLLIAAGLPLFRINPKSETFKAMSGMHLKKRKTTQEMTGYMMGLHIESIKQQQHP
jgi:hypothetical protein